MNEPQRVRVTKLQDAQIDAVAAIDLACKQLLHRAGVSAVDAPARGLQGLVKLTKLHNLLVADADGTVAGYAAWRDESPGVAYLEDLGVKPELQRHHVATKLLDAVREEARKLSLPVLLTRCWTRAAPARAFFQKVGFVPLGDEPPQVSERVTMWREEQEAPGGHGVAREGQTVLLLPLP